MRYITKRILQSILLVFGIATAVFVLLRVLPNEPFAEIYLNPRLPDVVITRVKSAYGLDKPLIVQYLNWLKELASGNLGYSFIYRKPVLNCIGDAILPTLSVGIPALFFSFGFGIFIGIKTAMKRGKTTDNIISSLLLVIYSIPSFWLGLILVLLFSYKFHIFPPSQLHSFDFDSMNILEKIFDILKHIFLPSLTLGLPITAAIAKFTRNTMIEILSQTFIKSAIARGLDEKRIFYQHILPNALIPVITLFGLYLPVFLAGSIVVEEIFSIPGIGKLTVDSIFQRDYPLVVGVTLFVSFIVTMGNLLSDILYSIFDPRIRLQK